MTLTEIIIENELDGNGQGFYNGYNFYTKNDKPCYMTEYAKDEDDVYSYMDLMAVVTEWLQEDSTKTFLEAISQDHRDLEFWIEYVYTTLEGESPEAFLRRLSFTNK